MVRIRSLLFATVLSLLTTPLLARQPQDPEMLPLLKPAHQQWSFSGPFGTFDDEQLKRGFKVYQEICSTCHSMKYVAFRHLKGLGLSKDEIKAIAQHYDVSDGPNDEGKMFTRKATPNDYLPSPFVNDAMAALANNGAIPPDLSDIAKARAVTEPFPAFLTNIFTNYTSAGPDYIVALLNGYRDAPDGLKVADGTYFNPYFVGGKTISMPPPLFDQAVTYNDGTPETATQYAKDVAAFLMWSADPHMQIRKQTGFTVISFLIVLAILLYYIKRSIFSDLDNEDVDGR